MSQRSEDTGLERRTRRNSFLAWRTDTLVGSARSRADAVFRRTPAWAGTQPKSSGSRHSQKSASHRTTFVRGKPDPHTHWLFNPPTSHRMTNAWGPENSSAATRVRISAGHIPGSSLEHQTPDVTGLPDEPGDVLPRQIDGQPETRGHPSADPDLASQGVLTRGPASHRPVVRGRCRMQLLHATFSSAGTFTCDTSFAQQ